MSSSRSEGRPVRNSDRLPDFESSRGDKRNHDNVPHAKNVKRLLTSPPRGDNRPPEYTQERNAKRIPDFELSPPRGEKRAREVTPPRNVKRAPDFDLMRVKYLQRLQQKKLNDGKYLLGFFCFLPTMPS